MSRTMGRWQSSVVVLVMGGALTVACTERSPGAASPQRPQDAGLTPSVSAPSAQRAAPPQVDTGAKADAGVETFVAWTDPAGVRALLRGVAIPDDDKDPRACNFQVPQQSCIPNAEAVEWDCKLECAKTCGECGTGCQSTLAACRAPCKGDGSCETACGQRAGACVQACLGTRDRCYTGECAKRVARYNERWRTNFGCKSKLHPLEICKQTGACVQKCQEKVDPGKAPSDACVNACKKKHADGCEQDFVDTATMGACGAFDTGI
jgi:hypothetical protein